MLGVKRMEVILEDAKVEDCSSSFHGVPVALGDDLCSSEAVLGVCGVASGYEDGGVIDFDFYGLFRELGQRKESRKLAEPERSWGREKFVEIDILRT